MATQTDGTDSMTTPQVTSEEIAKAHEFLREVRAVCRKHGIGIVNGNERDMLLWDLGEFGDELQFEQIRFCGSDIDLNEG